MNPPTATHPAVITALRIAVGITAVVSTILATGFSLQQDWAIQLWPWETGRLTYIFIGSILAAVAAGAAWIAATGGLAALPAGALNLAVIAGGFSSFLLLRSREPEDSYLWPYGLIAGALAVVYLAVLVWSRRLTVRDADPVPLVVRGSYVAFTAILLAVGGAMLLGGDILPWPTDPNTRVLIGWIFFGDAFYFLYGVLQPYWPRARPQLWSFLAYDLVLIGPLAAHLTDAPSDRRLNLWLYLAVLSYSGGLAIFYLVLKPGNRRRTREPVNGQVHA